MPIFKFAFQSSTRNSLVHESPVMRLSTLRSTEVKYFAFGTASSTVEVTTSLRNKRCKCPADHRSVKTVESFEVESRGAKKTKTKNKKEVVESRERCRVAFVGSNQYCRGTLASSGNILCHVPANVGTLLPHQCVGELAHSSS